MEWLDEMIDRVNCGELGSRRKIADLMLRPT
jgi:hypothetical protein